MEERRKRLKVLWVGTVMIFLGLIFPGMTAKAGTIYNSPYVGFAPDGQAWTTCPGELHNYYYKKGYTVDSGMESALRPLQAGEHYYHYDRTGDIPVGRWKVEWEKAYCIHSETNKGEYHGLAFADNICGAEYTQGWYAYCADCSEKLENLLVYMCEAAAESIDYIPAGKEYYYLCPHCTHLEQGAEFKSHSCQSISRNQYKIVYQANTNLQHTFAMRDSSFHMYNNATEYEGNAVIPDTVLAKMNIVVPGYEFVGWNTMPDGSGTWFADGQEIYNLTEYDWRQDTRGTITLYAQWKPSESTLLVDPAGGSYLGSGGVTSYTKSYMDTQTLYPDTLAAPDKATLSFHVNGGNPVAAIPITQHFDHWETSNPFSGRLEENTYRFIGKSGAIDRLTAIYTPDAVTLPHAEKANASFGGWYYDAGCTKPAGGPGDTITIDRDTTLYAHWVELTLNSVENYTANNKKGAVDLSWSQPDLYLKAYRVYKGRTPSDWTLIHSTMEEGITLNVNENSGYSGAAKTYTVPYTGLYMLTAAGAQGGNYGSYQGGLGGEAKGSFWLNAGDTITYTIGGQNGYNGGGTASAYGNGGGATVISSAEQGVLLVAAGGGGATSTGAGKAGGETAVSNLLSTGYVGENGVAGGGGGYKGGKAGAFHQHNENCYSAGTLTAGNAFYSTVQATRKSGWITSIAGYSSVPTYTSSSASFYAYSGSEDCKAAITIGNASSYFSTPGEGTLTFRIKISDWGINQVVSATRTLTVYSSTGTPLLAADLANLPGTTTRKKMCECWTGGRCRCGNCECETTWGWTWYTKQVSHTNISGITQYMYNNGNGGSAVWTTHDDEVTTSGYLTVTLPIGSNVNGIYVTLDYGVPGEDNDSGSCIEVDISNFTYTYSYISCGQSEVSTPAYGGSSYINTTLSNNYSYNHGSNDGNGYFTIQSENVGFITDLKMDAIPAPDLAAPDAVDSSLVEIKPVSGSSGSKVTVSWEKPEDNGTEYYFRVESYKALNGEKLCTSNIRRNTLTTGLKGYYYILNTSSGSTVTSSNARYTAGQNLQVTLTSRAQYLHIAAIDVAGNLGGTTTIPVGNIDGTGEVPEVIVPWPVYTEQVHVAEADGVWPAGESNTYYVRCDNVTPVELSFRAYIEGVATEKYQITNMVFRSRQEGEWTAKNSIITPMHPIADGEIFTGGSGLVMTTEGAAILKPYLYTVTTRSNRNRALTVISQFLIGEEADGKRIRVTPTASVETTECSVSSDSTSDVANSIYLVGDATTPIVQGTDFLEEESLLNRGDEEAVLQLKASDELSGLKSFRVEVFNEDNGGYGVYMGDSDGRLTLDLSRESSIFAGDFTVTIIAEDNVGNTCQEIYHVTGLALETKVERILAPHEPVFKRGESGRLTIETWGHVDRVEVEFPDSLSDYNHTYEYVQPRYRTGELIQFMVPLYGIADGGYEITVKVYKGGDHLGKIEKIYVSRTVLDELRTRLR